jgi:hypothetical protein
MSYLKMLGWIFNKHGGKLNCASFGRETLKNPVKTEGV